MTAVVLDVLGTPAPKGSSRAFLNRRTGRAQLIPSGSGVNKERLISWAAAVRERALAVLGQRSEPLHIDRPVRVEIEFRIARPAGHWGARGLKPSALPWPTRKPDIDKLVRSTLDALHGLAWDDDSRVCRLVTTKRYAAPGREGALIVVAELNGEEANMAAPPPT